jgi:uncharacterized protein (DUF983 family)
MTGETKYVTRKDPMSLAPGEARASPVRAGLLGRCPRCGKGHLFDGLLSVAKSCDVCGLSYAFADAGDGPAVFVILIVGFLIVGAALLVEVNYEPPLWVHGVIWIPLLLLLSIGLLRLLKGLLIALQFHHQAHEGRLTPK